MLEKEIIFLKSIETTAITEAKTKATRLIDKNHQ